MKDDSKEL
ncbi:Protein of unknown function [Bacillus mycoides]|nr:Protein of unknown function [Bacillus mycoides]